MTMKVVIEERKRFVYGNYYIKLLYSIYIPKNPTKKFVQKIINDSFHTVLSPNKSIKPLKTDLNRFYELLDIFTNETFPIYVSYIFLTSFSSFFWHLKKILNGKLFMNFPLSSNRSNYSFLFYS